MQEILFGNESINWNDVEQVLFTVNAGKDYRDVQIHIQISSGAYVIHPRYYKDYKEMRSLIEDICINKSIKYVTRDRGLY